MSMVTYQAQHTVHLGQIKSEIRAGETFQFDGQNLLLRGETHLLPSIKVAIEQGWFQEVKGASSKASSGKGPSGKTAVKTDGSFKAPVVNDQVASSSLKSQASSTPITSKDVQVRGVGHVSGVASSGFKGRVVQSDEDSISSTGKSFSGSVTRKDSVAGASQEGMVVGKVFKTATVNNPVINSDADLSRESSNLDKLTSASRSGEVDTRESQTVRKTGRVEVSASTEAMDTLDADGSFVTQTSDGVTMRVKGGFNRKNMKVVSMEGDTFMDENGVGAVVVGKAQPSIPSPIETKSPNQAAIQAADSGIVIDVTTPSQKSFAWDMSKHWKTRVREASQYRDQPEIYSQILAQETETVIKHLKA